MYVPFRITAMWCQAPNTAVQEPNTQPLVRQSEDGPDVAISMVSKVEALIANGRVEAELWALTKNSTVKSAVSNAATAGGTAMTAGRWNEIMVSVGKTLSKPEVKSASVNAALTYY